MTTQKSSYSTHILGYPRLGKQRELKFALESYWASNSNLEDLKNSAEKVQIDNWKTLGDLDYTPVGDFSFYDKMLDMALLLNIVPKRFRDLAFKNSYDLYFAMARGCENTHALEMSKWFNTNYHFIVPEFENPPCPPLGKGEGNSQGYLFDQIELAKKHQVKNPMVILIGPLTFYALSQKDKTLESQVCLENLFDKYANLLKKIKDSGVKWVQIDEPILATSREIAASTASPRNDDLYSNLLSNSNLNILIETYFDHVGENYEWLVNLPCAAIGLDFIYGAKNFDLVKKHGFPNHKKLFAGLVDGRNVFVSDGEFIKKSLDKLERFPRRKAPRNDDSANIVLSTSCSLLHVPISLEPENHLPKGLAFAEEKIKELVYISKDTEKACADLSHNFKEFQNNSKRLNIQVQERVRDFKLTKRSDFSERIKLQRKVFSLPKLPTTSIGSFPQTKEVRSLRAQYRKGLMCEKDYDTQIEVHTKKWIRWQENIDLDVLVHGEFERNDMVEYFAEKLDGYIDTKHGWVQSYGSRAYRAPIIYGDVSRANPMTVQESVYAQSLTKKALKGMLTGPVTMLNWSYVRPDISRKEVCRQIALALRDEVLDLEKNNLKIIQVDEPALREGLPLQKDQQRAYLDWAVEAFLWTTSGVQDQTQIHTHMCYSDFEDIIDDIKKLDADVSSIENARSKNGLLDMLKNHNYSHDVGPGVYDVHSPVIPSVDNLVTQIQNLTNKLDAHQIWVNPDCGLKTRTIEQTKGALENMVKATKLVRESL